MTKASDNAFPSILIEEATEPSAPAAGHQRLYIDSTTHLLKATNSSGTDRTIEGVPAGAVTTSGLTMATARLLGRTTASSGAIEEITVGSGLSLSAGSLTATGGSGITRAQLGYTSIGASFDNTLKTVAKKVTLATDGLISSINVALKGDTTNTANITVFVLSDNAGTPLDIVGAGGAAPQRISGSSVVSTIFINATARFIGFPIGVWLTAGDYWLCVLTDGTSGNGAQIAYDGSGADWTSTATDAARDQSITALSSTSNKYSVYADFLT